MKQKSRKLAWELLGVLARYSENDVAEALRLLSSGSILQSSTELMQLLATSAQTKRSVPDGISRKSRKRANPTSPFDREVDRIYAMIDSRHVPDQEALKDFANGVAMGRYLKGSRVLRDFAEKNLEIELPTKLPTRAVIALHLIEHLLRADLPARARLLEAVRRMDENSSLKAWSDLIVR